VFEFSASHLQSRYSITWATSPVHFALVILEIGPWNYLFGLAFNHSPPDLSPTGSWDYKCELGCLAVFHFLVLYLVVTLVVYRSILIWVVMNILVEDKSLNMLLSDYKKYFKNQ
jgi:hypothetical protein